MFKFDFPEEILNIIFSFLIGDGSKCWLNIDQKEINLLNDKMRKIKCWELKRSFDYYKANTFTCEIRQFFKRKQGYVDCEAIDSLTKSLPEDVCLNHSIFNLKEIDVLRSCYKKSIMKQNLSSKSFIFYNTFNNNHFIHMNTVNEMKILKGKCKIEFNNLIKFGNYCCGGKGCSINFNLE